MDGFDQKLPWKPYLMDKPFLKTPYPTCPPPGGTDLGNYFRSYSHVNDRRCNIYYIFGQVQKLTFVIVNFSVMFTDFGHIHSVILIRSSE